MTNVEEFSFDFLSGREAETVAGMADALDGVAWAAPLLREIPATDDLSQKDKPKLFELRFAYALHRAGIALRYEIEGQGNSTLDFGFASVGREWRVELMRLEETAAARAATVSHVDEDGLPCFGRILRTSAEDWAQSPEGETLKAVQRICQKCERDGLERTTVQQQGLLRRGRGAGQGWRRIQAQLTAPLIGNHRRLMLERVELQGDH